MLSKAFLLFSCLFICRVNANLGQGYNNGNQYGEPSVGRHNNGNNGFGQGYSPNRNGNQGEGSIAYAVPGRSTEQGLGQGTYGNNQGQGTYGNNQGLGQGTYGNNQGLGQGTYGNNQGYHQNGYSGLGRSNQEYSGLGRSQNDYRNNNGNYDSAGLSSVPLNQQAYKRMKRTLGQSTQSHGLGQSQPQGLGQSQPQGLGQSQPQGLGQSQPQGLGQSQLQGLGQPAQQPSLTQPGLKQDSGLGGSLRAKRYVEREPYSKSCNSYYGKFICYRLYEKDAAIPHEFTCWSTYLGKKNCTETENILYLDRRNVEVDASELDRQFYPNDRSQDTVTHRDQHRQRSDEFGAVEKNLHNRQYNDRELPRDSNHGEH